MATYIYKDDQQLGPFEDEQVLRSLTDGIFSCDDLAWREGWQEWKPLRSLYPPASPKYSSRASLAPAQSHSSPAASTATARKRRKSEFLGKGALVQLLAIVLFFVVAPFAGGLVALILALILFVI